MSRRTASSSSALVPDDDLVNQPDFHGEVETNDEIPSQNALRALDDYIVLDRYGKSHTFRSLYSARNVARRVLVIFVRHFLCGNCQEYLRTLSASMTTDALLGLPVATSIVVIGCGKPELIGWYAETTGCEFSIFTDPTRQLYRRLGMVCTLRSGPRPAYVQSKPAVQTVVAGVFQGLRKGTSGLANGKGALKQVGGEFLFEPASGTLETPIASPLEWVGDDGGGGGGGGGIWKRREEGEAKCVTWCHRMRTTRDHVEVPELMAILGLQGPGQPARDARRWQKAIATRKGTGSSMADQMSRGSGYI
ncbi:hypothetical protein F4802DRAFT_351472 [Xylaria palmicola]|nr:hypothetical protein F4802DRAFT_351472 [Xylaria palmicola]